jgi:hypothetical protein
MTDSRTNSTELWHRIGVKSCAIFALIRFGEAFLILAFFKWVIHGSAALYLLVIPWVLFGVVIVARASWVMRAAEAIWGNAERDMERLGRWNPPGFP